MANTTLSRNAARNILTQEFSRLGRLGTAPKTVAMLAKQIGVTQYSFR
tara:strand:- start:5828 stop:5971 length:144 start_codon:yes stop_codon:yes gene_type:complete